MDYIKEIDKLARQAAKVANDRIKKSQYTGKEAREEYSADWNIVYHDEVDRLAFLEGLRGTRKYNWRLWQD